MGTTQKILLVLFNRKLFQNKGYIKRSPTCIRGGSKKCREWKVSEKFSNTCLLHDKSVCATYVSFNWFLRSSSIMSWCQDIFFFLVCIIWDELNVHFYSGRGSCFKKDYVARFGSKNYLENDNACVIAGWVKVDIRLKTVSLSSKPNLGRIKRTGKVTSPNTISVWLDFE